MGAGKKFNLAEAIGNLPDVSESGTGRKQLTYISIAALDRDANNFYELTGIEELSANIQMCGLQQPLVVRPGAMEGRWTIVSGHRRAKALALLVEEGHEEFASVPCLIDDSDASPALQELRLIMANSDTRRMSDADLSKQAQRVEALFYQLSEEGYSFPGRMRDHVAEACQVSKTKLATLKVIRENLAPELYERFEHKGISTDAAYHLAHLAPELQKRVWSATGYSLKGCYVESVEKQANGGADYGLSLQCPDGKQCTHGDAFLRHDLKCTYDSCGGKTCCLKCDRATRDWWPCDKMCGKAQAARKKVNDKKKAKEQKEKEAQLKAVHDRTSLVAARLVRAADAAGLADDVKLSISDYRDSYSINTLRRWADGDYSTRDTGAYYSEGSTPLDIREVTKLLQIQKVLGCSFEYLLGLTDDLTPAQVPAPAAGWQTGTPEEKGLYAVKIADTECGDVGCVYDVMRWSGSWHTLGSECVVAWCRVPDETEEGGSC